MYRQLWNAPTNQHLFICYIRNYVAAKVTQGCTNSQNFINFRGEVNWNCLRKDFEIFQSAYDPLNMDTYIGNAPSVGGVFFRELHASLGECWNDEFHLPFIQEIVMVKPLSAITSSPGRRYSRNPEFAVMNLSLHLPPYAGEMNMISPHGAIETRYLMVFWP